MARKKRDNYELWREFADTYKLVHRAVDRNLGATGMRVVEIRLLKALGRLGAVPMSVLAEEQLTTQASVTGLVDDLEAKGLVQRERSTEDRRVINIAITEEGKRAMEQGLRRHRDFIDRVLGGLDEREAAELSAVLERLRRSMPTEGSL